MKECECGCGEQINAFWSDPRGYGQPIPRRFKHGHHLRIENENRIKNLPRGKHHYNWKGGRIKHCSGYIWAYKPDHHFADVRGYVLEHRLVWEEHHNAILLRWSNVHHINHKRDDNRIENLEGMMASKHHSTYHKHKVLLEIKCPMCGKLFKREPWRIRRGAINCSYSCGIKAGWNTRRSK